MKIGVSSLLRGKYLNKSTLSAIPLVGEVKYHDNVGSYAARFRDNITPEPPPIERLKAHLDSLHKYKNQFQSAGITEVVVYVTIYSKAQAYNWEVTQQELTLLNVMNGALAVTFVNSD